MWIFRHILYHQISNTLVRNTCLIGQNDLLHPTFYEYKFPRFQKPAFLLFNFQGFFFQWIHMSVAQPILLSDSNSRRKSLKRCHSLVKKNCTFDYFSQWCISRVSKRSVFILRSLARLWSSRKVDVARDDFSRIIEFFFYFIHMDKKTLFSLLTIILSS